METLLSKEETAKLYKKATPKEKKLIEKFHKKEDLIIPPKPPGPPITWAQVAKIKKLHPTNSLPFPKPKDKEQKAVNAFFMLSKIREVLNTDAASGKMWEPDWTNWNEYKYYPWFEYKSGVGFRFDDSGCGSGVTALGSRLVFKTRELAVHAGTHFIEIYKDFLTL